MVDLTETGWEEPLDKSPFELPEEWTGGSVYHTGGNIFCRVWSHAPSDIEIIYNLHNSEIGVQHQDFENNGGEVTLLETLQADTTNDLEKADVVEEYIHNEFDVADFKDQIETL